MYQITSDRLKAIIEVRFEGFWSVEQVADFGRDLRVEVERLTLTGKRQSVLYDYTGATIQSQAVIGALQRMACENSFRSRRVALFSTGRMARLQAQRIARAAGERLAVFDDRCSALNWLTS